MPTAAASMPAAGSGYFVQAGAFASMGNAERLRATLSRFGDTSIGETAGAGGAPMYRVRVGPYGSENEAQSVRGAMRRAGHGEARIVVN
jgi:rare lipoprotein A